MLILLVCAGLFFGSPLIVALLVFLTHRSRGSPEAAVAQQNFSPARQPQPAPPNEMSAESAILVARITHRFCPHCRSPLAADSPEGLCPACLMAGALGSNVAIDPADGTAATTPPSGSKPPLAGEIGDLQQHFPQLEIQELLGRGGMGAVYKARQKNLDRIVALKVIPPEAAKDPTFAERFGREARALARLNHPNIVTVYDFGEIGDLHYLLMEYVDGVNLRQTLRAGRLAPREAVAIVPPICDALQYAHDQGVVHRDIKPENVLLDRSGRVKIADFGLAKLLGKGPDDFTLTRTQQVMGTPRYMAPEQIERPSTVDHRADIYSLGVVIYEMLTGELPIGRFEPPSHKVQVDVRIDEVVLRSLEKDPQRRYQRASEVKTELASATSWPTLAAATLSSPFAGQGPGTRGNNGESARPSWHTPAHATKSDPPGGVPLAHVLMVAIGMVLGVLMMGGGMASIIYGLIYSLRGAAAAGLVWAWWGAGFGCVVGGAGSALGSYNTYRQLAGAEDLMRSRRTTWLDWIMWGYLVLGILILIPGVAELIDGGREEHMPPMLLLGGIATAQALLFLVFRTLYCFGAKADAGRPVAVPMNPGREKLRGRVAGPAIGLTIVGIIGLFPCAAMLLAVPFLLLVPVSDVRQRSETYQAVPSAAIGLPLEAVMRPTLMLAQYEATPSPSADMAAGPIWGMGLIAILTLFSLPLSLLLIIGGWRMRRLQSYGLAMIAAIAAILPCTFGWMLGLPIGLWALITLLNSDVREAFDHEPGEPEPISPKPASPRAAHVPGATPSGGWHKVAITGAVVGVLLIAIGLAAGLLMPAWQSARASARRMQSLNNLRQIGIALHNYHDVHGAYPPAVVTDASGRPLYSGRVLLLPFLEQGPLYEAFDKSQPWDSPQNRVLSQTVLPVFKDPSEASARATTDYLFITGAGTLFEAGKKVIMTDCRDGLANVMTVVEVRGSGTGWAEPRDIKVSQPVALPAGYYPGGNLALFADGSVRFIDKDLLSPSQVRALATIAGGEPLAMDPARFAAVLKSLQTESFDSGKVSFIRGLDRSQGFTSQQVRQLLEDFDFDTDRVEAAVLLHPHVVDPENFFTVLEAFTFGDGRQKVRQRLKME